jgi:hypothetical protein
MEIVKQMMLARAQAGLSSAYPESKANRIQQAVQVKSLRQRRADICENKPKAKVVLDYFKDLIQQNLEESEEEA